MLSITRSVMASVGVIILYESWASIISIVVKVSYKRTFELPGTV
jgi:hypothetical protein